MFSPVYVGLSMFVSVKLVCFYLFGASIRCKHLVINVYRFTIKTFGYINHNYDIWLLIKFTE